MFGERHEGQYIFNCEKCNSELKVDIVDVDGHSDDSYGECPSCGRGFEVKATDIISVTLVNEGE